MFKKLFANTLNLLPSHTVKNYNLQTAKNIVFMGYGYQFGDLLITTPVFREIKRVVPNAKIILAVEQKYKDIVKGNSYIDKIEILPKTCLSVFCFLFKSKADVVIDLPFNNYHKNIIIAYYFSKLKAVIMQTAEYKYKFINYYVEWKENEHFAYFLSNVPKLFGNFNPGISYDLFLPEEDKRHALDFIYAHFNEKCKILLINPEAFIKERTLSVDNVVELVNIINNDCKMLQVIVLSHRQKYPDFLNISAVIYKSQSIMQTASIINLADYVLTVDTSIVHISDFFNKKMIALYSDDKFSVKGNFKKFCSVNSNTVSIKAEKDKTVNDIKKSDILKSLKLLLK